MFFSIAVLVPDHNVSQFKCGIRDIDRFLQNHALANAESELSRTFVVTSTNDNRVIGYYTLSTGSVHFQSVPEKPELKKIRYPIPTIHLGKLAVNASDQGKGIGELLLVDAISRAVRLANDAAAYAIDLYSDNDRATSFYERYGFTPLLDQPNHLFQSMKQAGKLNDYLSNLK